MPDIEMDLTTADSRRENHEGTLRTLLWQRTVVNGLISKVK